VFSWANKTGKCSNTGFKDYLHLLIHCVSALVYPSWMYVATQLNVLYFMTLYIHNLGDQITSESLEAVFATHGTVHSARLVRDQYNGRSRSFAVVDMPDERQAQKAIEKINGFILNGRAITVSREDSRREKDITN
jgi:RNA recognition motif-containing protein